MLKIIVCDDDIQIIRQFKFFFSQLKRTCDISPAVTYYQSYADILSAHLSDIDVCILDIELQDGNGLDVAKRLRARFAELEIIFISSFTQYAIEGYRVHAFDFIKKPFTSKRLLETLLPCFARIEREKSAHLNVKSPAGVFQVAQKSILYVETFRGHTLLHIQGKEDLECRASMTALESQLERDAFFRCHTSYIVNLEYVTEVLSTDLMLNHQIRLAVSKHRKRELMERIADFWGNRFL